MACEAQGAVAAGDLRTGSARRSGQAVTRRALDTAPGASFTPPAAWAYRTALWGGPSWGSRCPRRRPAARRRGYRPARAPRPRHVSVPLRQTTVPIRAARLPTRGDGARARGAGEEGRVGGRVGG